MGRNSAGLYWWTVWLFLTCIASRLGGAWDTSNPADICLTEH
jgi:hypothetical protein